MHAACGLLRACGRGASAVSVQDRRVVDAVRAGVGVSLARVKKPLEDALGDPLEWVWQELEPKLGKALAEGIIATLGALGIETGRVHVSVGADAQIRFEILPAKNEA